MSCKNHKHFPEPNRLLKCKGHDWSAFTVEGMFIPYKPGSPKKLKGKSRFCTKDQFGNWQSNREIWKDVDEWDYADNPPTDKREEGK